MTEAAPSRGLWVVWGASCAGSAVAAFVLTLFGGMFVRPHAFGARDGQGAAVLALAVVVGSLVALLVTGGVSLVVGRRLAKRLPAIWLTCLAAPATAALVGLLLALVG